MTKREMIDEILSINLSAEPRFLARFADDQISEYLTHLRVLATPRLTGSADRYDKYFRDLPKVAARPQWRTDIEHAEEVLADELDEADQADDYCLEEQPAEQDAVAAGPGDELVVQASYGQELVARDVDLAVGCDEREQLLSSSCDLDAHGADDQEPDEAEMEAPFKIAASPRKAPSRARASTTPKQTPYSTDSSQAPSGRSKRRAGARAHAAAAPQPPVLAPEAEQDKETWLY